MPKKIFAVTNVKLGSGVGEYFAAGSEVDHTKLTKALFVELHEAGAVEIREVDADAPDPVTETKPEVAPNPEAKASTENPEVPKTEGSDENE